MNPAAEDTLVEEIRQLRVEVREMREQVLNIAAGHAVDDPLFDAAGAASYLRIKKSAFYERLAKGEIPPPDNDNGRRGGKRWRRSTLDRRGTRSLRRA